jgi:hypothetical protein
MPILLPFAHSVVNETARRTELGASCTAMGGLMIIFDDDASTD